ncbi:MAG: Bug family tripartite tricarboxylate transporter substrate binding protein, partial [Burkholderiaceae bacterium]
NMLEVPYKGSVQAITDIAGGTLDMMFDATNSAYTYVTSDRVKAIATSGPTRYFGLPNIPTLKESGIDVEVVGFTVLMAPAGTPAPIVNRLNGTIQEILKLPDTEVEMRRQGLDIHAPRGPEATTTWLANEGRRWEQVAAAANIAKQ